MQTTFILAQHFGVTPFEIMAQEIDEVIMVINYLLISKDRNEHESKNEISEKEQDKSFWDCL